MAKIIKNKHGAFVNEDEHEANLAEANAVLNLHLKLKKKSDKPAISKPKIKERILLLAPVKSTGDYTFYVCHELIKKGKEIVGLSLIAPIETGKEEALRIGMYYNSARTNLPPYVFRVHYSEHRIRLRNQLANTLCYLCEGSNDSYKGHYKVLFVDGWDHTSGEAIYLDI